MTIKYLSNRRDSIIKVNAFLLILLLMIAGFSATASVAGLSTIDARSFEARTGDLDMMIERRLIRVLVVYSKTFYFLDGSETRGITYDLLKEFEKLINAKVKSKTLPVHVVFVPVQRDELLPLLLEGRGDIAVAGLTITPERQKQVDFSDPFLSDVDEILVTGPSAPAVDKLDDLPGKQIYVRQSSSYYDHLKALNATFKKAGKPAMILNPADEFMEDEDLLEMLNAGLIPMTVVDDRIARFWKQIFNNITLHPEISIHTGGQIAWAFRKNSPRLKETINAFSLKHRKGTALGNILLKRYLTKTDYVKNALSSKAQERFRMTVDFFRKYAGQYGFDYLAVAAQGFQESGLDQNSRSAAGAIGVMQLLPKTAADPAVGIPNIEKIEPNIHAGVKYLRHIHNTYFKNAQMDDLNKELFSFAAYNAGPARISRLRKKAPERGLDPNVWFRNVELLAAEDIGRETVQYVEQHFQILSDLQTNRGKTQKEKRHSRPIRILIRAGSALVDRNANRCYD